MRQLVQLLEIEPKLTELGYQILGVCPDAPDKLIETAEKRNLTYGLLSDGDLAAARAFGIAFQREGKRPLPVPAVYIIGTDGVILVHDVHPKYRVRLGPDLLVAAAKAGLKK